MRVPGGGTSCLCVGRPGSGALQPPTTCPLGRAAGAHHPLAVGAGVVGTETCHQPHSARSCELVLPAVAAARGRPGGAPLTWVWGARGRRSPIPDHLSFWACGRGPIPTGCGCWGCGRGDPSPTPPRALLRAGFARCGGGTRAPGGGASCLGVGRPGSALSRPRPLVLLGVRPGPTTHWLWVQGVRAWGPVTNPSARALASWLCALWGRHEGPRGGAPLAWVWGVRGRALSQPRPLVLSGVRPGPTTHWLWVRGVRAWGPITNPTARALACCLGALWGRHEGARGGHLLSGGWVSGVGRSPTPDHLSFQACGWGSLPTGCGCGGCGRRDPSPTPQRALLRAGFARCWGQMRVPGGGGTSCPGVGRPGSGALPAPTTRPFERAAGAQYPLAVGAGDAGVGTRHQPHSARSCELALRAVGAARGRLWWAPLAWVWGARGRRSPTPDHSFFRACGRGPLPTGCGRRGCGRGDPSPTPYRALLRAGFARCRGGMRIPGWGRLLPGCGPSGVGRSPTPDRSSFGACGRSPLPTGCGCGGCVRGDPSPTPQRALLRAGFARCGGGTRVPRGGRLLPGCGASGLGRSPTPDHSSFRACGRGPLPTCCGRGECGRGNPSPTPHRALLRAGLARSGGGMRVPGGGTSCLGMGRQGSGALPTPTTRPLGRAAGAHYPLAVGAGDAGVGTGHQPHRARSCELALRAVGAARGRPGGCTLAWVWGVRGRALSQPRPLVLWGVRPGPTTHWLWVRGMRAWEPVTNPTARALASWLCALWGQHEGARGGALLPACGASGVGRSPTPDHSSFRACGRGPLPTGCGRGGCGRGDPSPTPRRALASWLCALWGRHEGARGRHLLPGHGAPGVGRSLNPDHSSFGACGRGPLPTGCGCGGCGRGNPSPTPPRALLRAGFARCGGGTGAPGGVHSCLGVGRPGSGALPPPTTRPFGRAPGAHYPLAVGAGGAGVGTRHQAHSARSCVLALRAVWVA